MAKTKPKHRPKIKLTIDQLEAYLFTPLSEGGALNKREQASARACLEVIKSISTHYLKVVRQKEKAETPKGVENLFGNIKDTARLLAKQLSQIGPQALRLLSRVATKSQQARRFKRFHGVSLKKKGVDANDTLHSYLNPETYAWIEADGEAWFLSFVPRTAAGIKGLVNGGPNRVHELDNVALVAEFIEAQARSIKESRTRMGVGSTFGREMPASPMDFLFRWLRSELEAKGMPIGHARPIGVVIVNWAEGKHRDEWLTTVGDAAIRRDQKRRRSSTIDT